MHDDHPAPGQRRPVTWAEAFARLPTEAAPAESWGRLAAALDAVAAPRRRRVHPSAWLALAATLALAVALPVQRAWESARDRETVQASAPGAGTGTGAATSLDELHAESALLETLLAHAHDGSVATGPADAVAAELESRLAAIDAALADPVPDPDREHALWSERVETLESLVGLEGTRRWLAANGERYDGELVQVN